MSIANIICQGQQGHLITDSGYFYPDGRIAFLRPKVLELPALRVAIAARGKIYPREHLGPLIARAAPTSLGALLEVLPSLLFDVMDRSGAFRSPENQLPFATTLYAVYFDPDRSRAGGLILSSTGEGMPDDYAPMTFLPVLEASAPGVDMLDALGRDVDVTDPAVFDPARDGLGIAEAQRRDAWSFNGSVRGHFAAGDVRLTTVDAAGVRSRVLHRWPERAGASVAA